MKKNIVLNNTTVTYTLQYKRVKNINLRIKPDGTVNVSANRFVPTEVIEKFLISKSDFILNALKKYENCKKLPLVKHYSEEEIRDVIIAYCRQIYPHFEKRAVPYPEIKFRKMTSRWGSCHPVKRILTFNTNLMYAPSECIEYVVIHEFAHFLQANHSPEFYKEVEILCPAWKKCRKKLREININC